jgi:hypothetical protein
MVGTCLQEIKPLLSTLPEVARRHTPLVEAWELPTRTGWGEWRQRLSNVNQTEENKPWQRPASTAGPFGSSENIYSLVPNNLAFKSASIMSWFRLAEDEKRKDFELALVLRKITQSFSRSRMSMSLAIFRKLFSTSLVRERPGLFYSEA